MRSWVLHWSSWFRWPFPWLLFSLLVLVVPTLCFGGRAICQSLSRVLQHSQFYSCIPYVKCCWDPNTLQGQAQSSCWLLLKKHSCRVLFPRVRLIPPSLQNQFSRQNILIRKVYEDYIMLFQPTLQEIPLWFFCSPLEEVYCRNFQNGEIPIIWSWQQVLVDLRLLCAL